MPKVLQPGELPKIGVSIAFRADTLQALDANIQAIKSKLLSSFDWPDQKQAEKALRRLSRSYVISELCRQMATPEGAQSFYSSMAMGIKAFGIPEKVQSDLFT